ncbi:MAG TPA: PAS domain S-box protein [Rubricoccaceae bacterium]|nr:PAS domain S-box protein [Rubricoccaceae bacterium]
MASATTLSDELLQALAGQLPLGLSVFCLQEPGDPASLKLLYSNERAGELTGLDLSGEVGKTIGEIAPLTLETPLPAAYAEAALLGVSRDLGPIVYGDERIEEAAYSIRVFPLPDRCVGVVFESEAERMELRALREAQEALQRSEQRYRLLLETASDAIVTIGTDNTIHYANPAVEHIFGYAPGELEGERLTRLMPEDYRGLHEAAVARYLETGEKRLPWGHIEVPGLRKDGTTIPLAISFGEYRQGGVHFFTGILRDVSAQQEAQEALRASESRYRALADALPQIIWTSTPEGVPDYYNERWYAYTGMPRDGALQTNWGDYVHPDDRGAAFAEFARAASTKTPFEKEYRFRRHDGTYRWFLGRAIPVLDEEGDVTRWFGSATDITAFREAQTAVQASQARYHTLFQAASDVILSYPLSSDGAGLLSDFNEAALRLYGYTADELRRMTLAQLLAPGAPGVERVLPTLLYERSATLETAHVTRDGRRVPMEMSVRLLELEGALTVFAVCRDITDRRAAQRLMLQTTRELEARVAERTATLAERERELLRARRALQQILDAAGEGIYGLDLSGTTTFVNPVATELTGWTAEELRGKPQHEIIHHHRADGTPYPVEACPIYQVLRDGQPRRVDDEVFWRKDGTPFPVEYVVTPLHEDDALVGAVVVFRPRKDEG